MEQGACSSCSLLPPLESSNGTEIITIRDDSVPGVPSEVQSTFLIERLLKLYRRAMERLRLGQDDGGAPNSVPQDPQDDDNQDNKAEH